jgi:thiamine biosynthesis lipoprotein
MSHQLRFDAMGTFAHVIVLGGRRWMLDRAREHVVRLEAMWSRFDASSEVSQMNRSAGRPVSVSAETLRLVEHALEGWDMTGGWFDPTLLNELVAAGYDRDFAALERVRDPAGRDRPPPAPPPGGPVERGASPEAAGERDASPEAAGERRPSRGRPAIDVDAAAGRVTVPPGVGFDSGGIGKGFGADLVVERLLEDGASGALVNLGGDLRVGGQAPPRGWRVDIPHPLRPSGGRPVASIRMFEGGLCTSESGRRRWMHEGREHNHLIDPCTGEPAEVDCSLATVVAAEGWRAEALSKAAFLAGPDEAARLLRAAGAGGLFLDAAGNPVELR